MSAQAFGGAVHNKIRSKCQWQPVSGSRESVVNNKHYADTLGLLPKVFDINNLNQ